MIKPFLFNIVQENMNLNMCEAMKVELSETPYYYDGFPVPRVTSVLSDMLNEEYLIKWANNVGRYKHISHEAIREDATTVGSAVHNAIENCIQNSVNNPDFNEVPYPLKLNAHNAFNCFINWWNIINQCNYKVLMEEIPLVTPYCGGTLDLLIEINGKIYLLDFKTSSQVGFKYYIQLTAYRRMLYELYGIIVDGMIILQLNKKDKNGNFTEYIVDLSNYEHLKFINYCDELFGSILHGYYARNIIENSPTLDEFCVYRS